MNAVHLELVERPGDVPVTYADSTALERDFGFTPKITLREGLRTFAEWYKEYYGIRYSDAYEVYGLTRTGCCGCPISYKAIDDLEKIRPYEPNVVKAAWAIFGKSYEYRRKYIAYKAQRMRKKDDRQLSLFDDGGDAE